MAVESTLAQLAEGCAENRTGNDASGRTPNGGKTKGKGKSKDARQQYIVLGIGVCVVLAGLFLPVGGGLTRPGLVSLSGLVLAVLFWSTEAVNANVTALIVLAMLPALGALSYQEAFAGFGNPMIWRLVGIMIITIGLSKSGLDRRMAFHALKLARGNVYAMLVLMLVTSQILVFFVPVPQARTSLLATTYLGILTGLNIRAPSNIGKIVFIGIPVFTVLTSASLITGASVEVYAVGLFSTLLNHNFSYVSWMVANLPVTFAACFVILPALIWLYPPETKRIEGADALVSRELAAMGPLNLNEKKMLAVFAILSVMWFGGISESIPAEVLMATTLFLPGIAIIKWADAQDGVPWGTVILFGSSLALAMALQQNKVIQWVADGVMSQVGAPPPVVTLLLIFLLAGVIRLGMTNMTGVVATLFPLSVAMAPSMGLNPVWLGMVCVIGSSMGFFYPSQNASCLLTYAFGYYSSRDMAKAGLISFLLTAVVLAVLAQFYWPLVGIPVQLP
jgi:solute carrier family 13 (sodium-dependent dicarboxylate transporter), member 2/3/5